jgi:hypothetical protein
VPQSAFRRAFHIEHIIARQHGGLTEFDNLALSCWSCNFKKGPNLSGLDTQTGQINQLFHPRDHAWEEHLSAIVGALNPIGIAIVGLTPIGRATVQVLGLNEEMRQLLRYELWSEGLYAAEPRGG